MAFTSAPLPPLSQSQVKALFNDVTKWTEYGEDKFVPWLKRNGVPIDPLAICCTIHRTEGERDVDTVMRSLSDKSILPQVTDADIELANTIREERGKQLVLAELARPAGQEPSEYEKSLAQFLDTENQIYNTKWEGMIYKLPEFYQYDCDVAEIKAKHFNVTPSNVSEGKRTFTLKPLKKLRRVTRNKRVYQYWCADVEENTPVILEVPINNNLDSVWNMLFDVLDKVEVDGVFYTTTSNRLRILASDKWKVKTL